MSAIPLTVDTDSDTGSKQLPHSSPVAAISCWTGQLPQAAANVMQQASAAIATGADGAGGDPLGSTEHLLRNIQGLLKVATDSARQKERQVNYEKGECHTYTHTNIHSHGSKLQLKQRRILNKVIQSIMVSLT